MVADAAASQEEFSFLTNVVVGYCRDPDRTTSPPEVGDRSIEWQSLHELAQRHGLVPQLRSFLEDHDDLDVPDGVRSAVESDALGNHPRNLKYAAEMHSLVSAFEAAGVRALPYKGPVLTKLAYGDVGRRQFGDLDFLVPPEDVPDAAAVLEAAGYERTIDLDPYDVQDIPDGPRGVPFPYDGELKFLNESEGIPVELRYARGETIGGSTLDVESLWQNRTTVSVAGRDTPALSSSDRIVVLADHGTKHLWERFEWLLSLANVIERTDPDWPAVRRSARDRNTLDELYLGVLLCDHYFEHDVPADVLRSAERCERCSDVASTLHGRYHGDPTWSPSQAEEMRLLGELRGDRLRRRMNYYLQPSVHDYRLASFPEPLWPLYRAVRLWRGVRKLLRVARPGFSGPST